MRLKTYKLRFAYQRHAYFQLLIANTLVTITNSLSKTGAKTKKNTFYIKLRLMSFNHKDRIVFCCKSYPPVSYPNPACIAGVHCTKTNGILFEKSKESTCQRQLLR